MLTDIFSCLRGFAFNLAIALSRLFVSVYLHKNIVQDVMVVIMAPTNVAVIVVVAEMIVVRSNSSSVSKDENSQY